MAPALGLPQPPVVIGRPLRTIGITVVFLVACVLCSHTLQAATPIASLRPYITHGGYAVQKGGTIARASNLNSPFIPASTIKVLTGLMALEILGPQYRFATYLYLDSDDTLYIKGEGDPFLTSEAVADIARKLSSLGITTLRSLVLDDSSFALEGPPPGSSGSDNPYDAASGALAVNFNALPFIVQANGAVQSGEPQTPLLPMMKDFGRSLGPGRYRVNVSSFAANGHSSNMLRYSGELIGAIFEHNGIAVAGGFRSGNVPASAQQVLVYESGKTVEELVRLCLYYSSNFIANQLYLSCGSRVYGFPATWQKARKMTDRFVDSRLPEIRGALRMVDGSGLSLDNRITPAAMLHILDRFAPHLTLMKKRGNAHIKSGTLTGVYSYVGYFDSPLGPAPFALFLNQASNRRNTILKLMEREFKASIDGR